MNEHAAEEKWRKKVITWSISFTNSYLCWCGVQYMLDENWSHKDTVKISTVNGIDVRYRTKSLFAYLFSTQKPNFFAGRDAKLFFHFRSGKSNREIKRNKYISIEYIDSFRCLVHFLMRALDFLWNGAKRSIQDYNNKGICVWERERERNVQQYLA